MRIETRQLIAALVPIVVTLASCGESPPGPVAVDSITIAPASLELHRGAVAQLSATTRSRDGATLGDRPVTWSTDNGSVATVSGTGLVTAVAVGGPARITATSEGASATATVTVTAVPIASIAITPAALALEAGDTARLTATPRSATGESLSGRTMTWTSADASVATVSASGLVTAIAPGGPMSITATSEGIQGTAQTTVMPAAVGGIAITPDTASIVVGSHATLTVEVRDARGAALTGRTVVWSSSNPARASVAQNGTVTGVSVGGQVSIVAESEGVADTARVTVIDVPVRSVQVVSPATEVNDGATLQLTVGLTDADGNALAGRSVTWSSDSTHIATVDATGLVHTLRAGTTRIRARAEGVEGSVMVNVRGLLYRWTFSEEGGAGTVFRDDLRGATARIVSGGSLAASAIAGQVTLSGGDRNQADYVALPSGLLRDKSDATIEIWATLHSLKNWSRVFDIGSSPANNLFIAWSQGVDPLADRTGFTVNGVENRADRALAPFTIDLQHHIVLTIDEGGGTGGATRLVLYLDGVPRKVFETSHRLRDLIDTDFWLGRSHHGDETANASYDEVRIHDRAYAGVDVQQFFVRGPVRSAQPASIAIVRQAGIRDTIRGLGVRAPLRAVGQDILGRQFPVAGARWTSSNPSVATVDSAGILRTLTAGRTQIGVTVGTWTAQWTADVVRMRRVAVDPYLATPAPGALWEVPVVLIEYLPTADGATIDTLKNPDFYWSNPISLDSVERNILRYAQRRKMSVEQGSRFQGYKDVAALPSLGYRVVEHIIVYELEPPSATKRWVGVPGNPAYPDWFQIFADLQLEAMMRAKHVREIWIADSGFDSGFPSYDPKVHRMEDFRVNFESNMASPTTGDVSNSYRWNDDLPILPHTYIVYGINFRRSQSEAVHVVGHQMEAMLGYVAARQTGNDRLFWRDFVGQDAQKKFITGRAGWTHMPPNTTANYDYLNATLVPSDIEDWRPDNAGQRKAINVDTWGTLTYPWPGYADFDGRVETQWYTYWFQNFPGRGNRVPYGANWMTNWWAFVADWDAAINSGLGLFGPTQAAARGSGTPFAFPTAAFRGKPELPGARLRARHE